MAGLTDPEVATIRLCNGVRLPAVGLGTFRLAGEEARACVEAALRTGVRHVDTASIYRNAKEIAEGIAASGVPRQAVFVTSKVSPYEQGTVKAARAVDAIVEAFGGYVDLLLIHWPGAAGKPAASSANARLRLETWRVLEDRYRAGQVRAIGVSNYEVSHLRELWELAVIKPMVNQIECHPRLPQAAIRTLCADLGIAVVAYASLGAGTLGPLDDRTVQALLQWGLSRGCAVIPKTSRVERIPVLFGRHTHAEDENDDFQEGGFQDLGDEKCVRYCWDPSRIR